MKLINPRELRASGWKWWRRLSRRRKSIPRLLAALLLAVTAIGFWHCLPEPLFTAPYAGLLLDRNGRMLAARIAPDEQWRFPHNGVVPDKYRAAVIAFEDRRFDWHPGIDLLSVLRAGIQNLRQGRIVSGASTISMQVIRLSRHGNGRGYWDKLVQMVRALRLELRYSKHEILALYAANAPYGGNIVGLEAASRRYFQRPPSELSWAEAGLLAVLPNNPALLHPGRSRAALRAKRDRLLRRLHELAMLSELDLQLALAEPLPVKPRSLPVQAPHLLDTLMQQYGGGKIFHATVDGDLQQAINGITLDQGRRLQALGVHNLAVLVLDNSSFQVLAYIGNLPLSDDPEQGRAVDIVQRLRSTGSLLKPFLYAMLLERGELLPTTLVPDLPTQYGGYMPENYDHTYRGAVPAWQALARSLNVPAVRMLKQYGVGRFYDNLRRTGLSSLSRPPGDYGLTLILGGAEGSLWELTAMYANLARMALHADVAAAYPQRQATLLLHQTPPTLGDAPFGPGAAWLTLQALLEVTRPDSEQYWRQYTRQRSVVWKTGTSYGLRDAWAVGSDPRYTVGVWVGNADGEGRAGLTGVSAAAPILFDVFNRLPAGGQFPRPAAFLKAVTVCKDDGYLANAWCDTEQQWAPRDSHFQRQTPHFRLVHLDSTRSFQVHSQCEAGGAMTHVPWFILPPGQAYFYRRQQSGYRVLPPYRQDCIASLAGLAKHNPIALLYPSAQTRIYIPRELAGQRSRTVFQAAHQNARALLYWHLDDVYLGVTDSFHEMALDVAAGAHRLTLVDDAGNRLVRSFHVLSLEDAVAPL